MGSWDSAKSQSVSEIVPIMAILQIIKRHLRFQKSFELFILRI